MWQWLRQRERSLATDDPTAPSGQAWPLALIGAIIGGILGWLTGSGALPHPAFLPIPADAPLQTTLICAAITALVTGILGLLADLSDRRQADDLSTYQPHPES